jgi:tetratricopeptide (TPR) repeat protein
MFEIPKGLKTAISNRKLIVFAGAGLSFNLKNTKGQKLGDWNNLIHHILLHLKEKQYQVDTLISLLNENIYEPIEILNLIEKNRNLPKNVIYNFTKEFLDLDYNINDYELHKNIAHLSNKIITTNYDTAFEIADPTLRKYTAYKGKNYELTTHKNQHARLLFKLHGCYEFGDSMVLFPSNYNDLYANAEKDAEHSLLVLKNIIYNNSLLFIGTGMGDYQINTIFKEIQRLQGDYQQEHFILTTQELDSTLSFLTPVKLEGHDEIPEFISTLTQISKEKSSDDEQIEKLKGQLTKALKEIESLKLSPQKKTTEKLLEEEALKYFAEGVEFSLAEEYEKAIEKYKRSTELKPYLHEAFYNWGNSLGHLAKTRENVESHQLYHKAFEKYKKTIEIKPDFYEAFNNWGTDLGNLANTQKDIKAEKFYRKAFDKYENAVKIKPDYYKAFNNWGTDLSNLAKTKTGIEKENLYYQAFKKYEKATEIKSDFHEALNNWGNSLGNLAKTKLDAVSESLYHKAFEKYENAVKIKPDYYKAFNNWGIDLVNLAKTKVGIDSEKLYYQAFEKYRKAISIKPNLHEAFYNWATGIGDLAKTKTGIEVNNLYYQAFEKYEKALAIKPDLHEVYNNWGIDLRNLAKTKSGLEVDKLYHQAFNKYEKAIEIKSDFHDALYSWGTGLMFFANTKTGVESNNLLNQAFEKLQKSADLEGKCYNLSCMHAIHEHKDDALKYLKQSLQTNEISADFVIEDEDWKNYLEDPDFIKLINEFKSTN